MIGCGLKDAETLANLNTTPPDRLQCGPIFHHLDPRQNPGQICQTPFGNLRSDAQDPMLNHLIDRLPMLPHTFMIRLIGLVGEEQHGFYFLLHPYALAG